MNLPSSPIGSASTEVSAPATRVNINFVGSLASAGASNFGYMSDGSTTINLISRETDPNDTNAASIVKMSFVAEFVEILMSYRNTQGAANLKCGLQPWGRAFPHVRPAAFPAGYQSFYGTWVNPWLQLPDRDAASHDWIINVKQTDKDSDSFGCSLLFLFYLESQLGYTMPDIIQKGGSTLKSTL